MSNVVVPHAELQAGEAGPDDFAAVPASVQPVLARLRGTISNGEEPIDVLLDGYREQVRTEIYAQVADNLRRLAQRGRRCCCSQ